MTTAATPPVQKDRVESRDSGYAHLNEIAVIGELAAPPQSRTLPSGDEVMSFRLTVRTPGPLIANSGKGTVQSRTDSLDCAAWRKSLHGRLERCGVGDVLQVNGALRHRYWRGPGGLASRYEIEADRIRVIRRAPRASASQRRDVASADGAADADSAGVD